MDCAVMSSDAGLLALFFILLLLVLTTITLLVGAAAWHRHRQLAFSACVMALFCIGGAAINGFSPPTPSARQEHLRPATASLSTTTAGLEGGRVSAIWIEGLST